MIHIPLVLTAALIPLAGLPLLYMPTHIVWLELVIHPTALLVFQELPASARLQRAASSAGARFFNRREWCAIALVGAVLTGMIVAGYGRSLGSGDVEHARAMALATLSCASATLMALLSGLHTVTARVIGALTLLAALVLIQVPSLATLLHLRPLHADDWLIVAVAALCAGVPSMLGRFRG